jgi:hypothetical protein
MVGSAAARPLSRSQPVAPRLQCIIAMAPGGVGSRVGEQALGEQTLGEKGVG